jgi:predicted nuclease with RNAse H fold
MLSVTCDSNVVVGIDVGSSRKGFHAVALRDGVYYKKLAAKDAELVVQWCEGINADVIGVDAPCRWSLTGRARSAERALAAEGIRAFATPRQLRARESNFYQWMLNGTALYALLEHRYKLFDGHIVGTRRHCFETFPQAVACTLARAVVSAKKKAGVRRELLRNSGMQTTELNNIDMVDAALCALTADYFRIGNVKKYGEAIDGFIVVPLVSSGDCSS